MFRTPSVNFSPSLRDMLLILPLNTAASSFPNTTPSPPFKYLPLPTHAKHSTQGYPPGRHSASPPFFVVTISLWMEAQNHIHTHEDANSNGGARSTFFCRQASTRWIPTTDQIRILKDLYDNRGVRSPSAEEIQRISARLRQYGKIEGKNVFYWFQNHKARERQKKRLNVDVPLQRGNWKLGDLSHPVAGEVAKLLPSDIAPCRTPSSPSQLIRWGSAFTCNSSWDSPSDASSVLRHLSSNTEWINVEPFAAPRVELMRTQVKRDMTSVETLQLFPMHGEEEKKEKVGRHGNSNRSCHQGWLMNEDEDDTGCTTSLELSLTCYDAASQASSKARQPNHDTCGFEFM